ncbi:uncharacterized protein MONOS_17037 [Monocercomonoides exilis]|uniref:uncharacterized protein n=1 Tax=Monocercomonoides exilis TaxID=2049356 RepID=UPI003559996B|nr:hypothetical protein MONOS_17037 [Monocercomonoides exilis]
MQVKSANEKFTELFDKLEGCKEEEQMQKIEEMNELMEEMNENEFISVISIGMFEKMHKMIEEKKMTMKNAFYLMEHIGHCKELKGIFITSFYLSKLYYFVQKMIINEIEKKEEKNEKILADLCECYLLLSPGVSSELLSISVPCLLKVALRKEESEETRKEVEMALLAVSNAGYWSVEQKLYLNEIKEIVLFHQKHHNLTHLAYQSIWLYLIYRLDFDKSLEREIVFKLHFLREVKREMEELTRCVDWKRKEKERGGKVTEDELILMRWFKTLGIYFSKYRSKNEEFDGFIDSIVKVLRAARENKREISNKCIYTLREAAKNESVRIDDLLKEGAVEAVLEEIQQSASICKSTCYCLRFFLNISRRLREKTDNEMEEVNRKAMKMEIFEKMEEGGYEDAIASFHEIFGFLNNKFYGGLSLNISDYSVNV